MRAAISTPMLPITTIFFIEDETRLIDIPLDEVALSSLPNAPSGYDLAGVDVVIRLLKASA